MIGDAPFRRGTHATVNAVDRDKATKRVGAQFGRTSCLPRKASKLSAKRTRDVVPVYPFVRTPSVNGRPTIAARAP